MELLGFDRRFTLLAQECHLTRATLLSGFDQLLKANLYEEKDGLFYSAFFNISIGMERLLKLAMVTHHMLINDYRTPKISELKNEYGHKIEALYNKATGLIPHYSRPGVSKNAPELSQEDASIIDFFSEYAIGSRYFNLNEVCEAKMKKSPINQWFELAQEIYRRHTPSGLRERANLNIFYQMDKAGIHNGFTRHKDEGAT